MLQNLAAVAAKHRRAGIRLFVLAYFVRSSREAQACAGTGVPLRVVRPEAPLPDIERRLATAVTSGRRDDLREAAPLIAAAAYCETSMAPALSARDDLGVLANLWPLFGLTVQTSRLELRLPREQEIAELATIAGNGVHHPDERPFLTPWTAGDPLDRARFVLQEHWSQLGTWSATDWRLGLGVFLGKQPLGVVTLRARDFPVVREVSTSSWLGLPHHGQGYGTEARAGLLMLAFGHLGADAALTEVFQDNHSSQGVSRKLGYEPDGISRDARGGEAVVSDRLRLTRQKWQSQPQVSARVAGFADCRSMFGL